jgi:hypothetical protein
MVGHLSFLWLHAQEYKPDGNLEGYENIDIAEAAGWEGDADLFVQILMELNWLDEDLTIHDWNEYSGYLTEKQAQKELNKRRAQGAERQRKYQAKLNAKRDSDVSLTSDDVANHNHNYNQPPPHTPPGGLAGGGGGGKTLEYLKAHGIDGRAANRIASSLDYSTVVENWIDIYNDDSVNNPQACMVARCKKLMETTT